MSERGIVAERIEAARLELGISQAELARRAGLHSSAVNHFERGIRRPNTASLMVLKKVLGKTMDHLMGGDDAGTEEVAGSDAG